MSFSSCPVLCVHGRSTAVVPLPLPLNEQKASPHFITSLQEKLQRCSCWSLAGGSKAISGAHSGSSLSVSRLKNFLVGQNSLEKTTKMKNEDV